MRLISFEEDEIGSFDIDKATDLVSEISWDTGNAQEIKSARLDLFACFHMDPPKKKETGTVKVQKQDDALSNYASLVNHAGY
mmetsp:Transcript_15670/g.39957  ORF Transcript_15670/g.39957 Transcript_15670/m.39957 type:complete len:82 (+) Transcript_15670:122-367(+)